MSPANFNRAVRWLCLTALTAVVAASAYAQTAPAVTGPIDPGPIPKYQIPLVIPPEMPKAATPTEAGWCSGSGANCPATAYNIAVRQFQQQILPGGVWKALGVTTSTFAPTTVWGYGPGTDPIPNGLTLNGVQVQPAGVAPVPAVQSSFNYPSFTVENLSQRFNSVRWINELVAIDPATGKPYALADTRRSFLPHLLTIDRSLHFANPEMLPCANPIPGGPALPGTTNCRPNQNLPILAQPYDGPVPMVVHVHGAEVNPYSDGFAEAWWLPSAFNPSQNSGHAPLPISNKYAVKGNHYDQYPNFRGNNYPGSAAFGYEVAQPAMTDWYHDHTLGMTANNVYTGPAGFWLVRGNYTEPNGTVVQEAPAKGVLPGSSNVLGRPTHPNVTYKFDSTAPGWVQQACNPATDSTCVQGCDPNFDGNCRAAVRDIPIAIQDRSFNSDGSLFYPLSRNFFDGTSPGTVPYVPTSSSDAAPIHNPEFFGNMIVVNGTVWPTLSVVPQRYRLRLLAGADGRTYNLSLWAFAPGTTNIPQTNDIAALKGAGGTEMPFYQIAAEQGFLPKVVKIMTGTAVPLPGNGNEPKATCKPGSNSLDPNCERALLMGPAERADVIVDFTGLKPGTIVRMVNTGPDVPYNGFPVAAADLANPSGTGQIMQFAVAAAPTGSKDPSTVPAKLVLTSEANLVTLPPPTSTRTAALKEEDSKQVCVEVDPTGAIVRTVVTFPLPQANLAAICATYPPQTAGNAVVPFGPTEVFVGKLVNNQAVPQPWADPLTQNPTQGDTDVWEIYNFTVDAHPMHMHGARFLVQSRALLDITPDAFGNTNTGTLAGIGPDIAPAPTEAGYKDTVVALPGYVTRVKATFEIPGLYVWHCHIVEHEDNEMMVPFCIKNASTDTACLGTPGGNPWPFAQ